MSNFIQTAVADLKAIKWETLMKMVVSDINKAAAFADALLAADPSKGPALVALESACGIIEEATTAISNALATADATQTAAAAQAVVTPVAAASPSVSA